VLLHFRRCWPYSLITGATMVETIISARQTPCNKINSKIFAEKSNNCPINTNLGMIIDGTNSRNTHPYLNFYSTKKIIHRFLNCDRVIFLPHIVPRFTEAELAKKLNITILQLKQLQKSSKFYKGMAKNICLPLASLYCSTRFQQPKPLHKQEVHHE